MMKLTALAVSLILTGSVAAIAAPSCCSDQEDTPSCCLALPVKGQGVLAQLASATEAEPDGSTALVAAYETLSAALFDGDMDRIRLASASLAETADEMKFAQVAKEARGLGETTSADAARKAFTSLSSAVIAVVESEPGYYIMSCPMVRNGQWLQSNKDLRNPYMGERMPKCGMLKRETGSRK